MVKTISKIYLTLITLFSEISCLLLRELFQKFNFRFRIAKPIRWQLYLLAASVFLAATILQFTSLALADDVGITKARLIQKTEKSYVLEADVPQALIWAIKTPIFPDRFQVSGLEYITQTGWIVVQVIATTSSDPLSEKDEILLPWLRNGTSLTVQWLDGSINQGLFLRSLEGIRIPLETLLTSTPSVREVSREHFLIGLKHIPFKGIHLILVGVLVLLSPSPKVFRYLLYYSFGQALSLLLFDIGVPGFDLLFSDILGSILVFLLAGITMRGAKTNAHLPLLFLYGLLHGLAYSHEIKNLELVVTHKLPALFMFNLALDMGHYLLAAVFLLLLWLLNKSNLLGNRSRFEKTSKKVAAYGLGTLSFTVVLLLYHEHVVLGNTDLVSFESSRIATQYSLPVSQTKPTGGQRPKGARRLTSPIMTYLSVEPYEVRQEILVQARAAVQLLGVDDKGKGSIPLESLEPVKQGVIEIFKKAHPVLIDGQEAELLLARADFVALGPAGVVIRQEPVPESLDNGIIGLTLIYETSAMADAITIDWQLFSDTVQKVEATTTDPFGGTTMVLTPADRQLRWKSRLSGYRVPVIEEIAVEKKRFPLVSLIFLVFAGLLMIVSLTRKSFQVRKSVVLSLVGLGFVFYPFATYPLNLPWLSQWSPAPERASFILEELLTNVYRAFDGRDEGRIYDRLAVSVTGDQLTKIYLENRKSLEFENRGGARANVDKVKMISIGEIDRSVDGGFVADAQWTVSGSVSHFGHTHYRQNRYHALVTFIVDDNSWKIRDIELLDEKRLL